MTLSEIEEMALLTALKKSGGNKSDTAEMLGISLKSVYNKLAKISAREEEN
jgi:DNA-binding NtrC family response regulator